uniref:Vacuolar protein sorting protein 46 n=1 Tax=Breviata anathema TaxID=81100 RepID=E9LD22_BREAA|nr:vacuolar protein sorting protein 46 [Breviata anathema]
MVKASQKCEKEEKKEKMKVRQAIEKGNMEGARIYAQNAIRQKNQALGYVRMASRIDAVASRVESAIRMRQVIGNLGKISQSMEVAMQSMDLEKISMVMDNFEKQFEDMDVRSSYVEGAMNQSTATTMPQSEVDRLIEQVADENNLDISSKLDAADPSRERPSAGKDAQVDDMMARLAALKAPQ